MLGFMPPNLGLERLFPLHGQHRVKQHHADADRNAHVGDIEDRERIRSEIKLKKIDNLSCQQPIKEIAECSPKDKAQADRQNMSLLMSDFVHIQNNSYCDNDRHNDEKPALIFKDTECGSGITVKRDEEKIADYRNLLI